jgi:lipopolysaccharide export system permease protein
MVSPSGGFWYRSGRLVYHVGRFVPETNTIEDLNAYVMTPTFQMLERIHARTARCDGTDWVLEKGFTIRYPRDTHFPEGLAFDVKRNVIPEKPGDFKSLKIREDMMRLKDLRRYIDRNAAYGLDTTAQRVHYHERVALVFTPLVFVLLGFPFALKPLKTQSMPKSIAFCFLIVFLYLLTFRMSLSIGKGGHIPPVVAGWAPNMLFLGIWGLVGFRRK